MRGCRAVLRQIIRIKSILHQRCKTPSSHWPHWFVCSFVPSPVRRGKTPGHTPHRVDRHFKLELHCSCHWFVSLDPILCTPTACSTECTCMYMYVRTTDYIMYMYMMRMHVRSMYCTRLRERPCLLCPAQQIELCMCAGLPTIAYCLLPITSLTS